MHRRFPGVGVHLMRILVIRLRSLGDSVLMTPLLGAAKASGAAVSVVLERPFSELFTAHPWIDELLPVQADSLLGRLRLVAAIRRRKFDLALDLHGGTTSGLIAAASGASRRVGFAHSRLARAFEVKVPDPREVWGRSPLHTVEYQLAMLKYLGFQVEPIPPLTLALEPEAVGVVRERLESLGARDGFVLVQPAAAFDTKQWPAERFAEVAAWCSEQGRQVVVTAGPGQETLVEGVVRDALARVGEGGDVWAVPPQPLSRFAALAARCGLYVGNDTGTTHVAAALQRPVVVIFGSSNPRAWHPWGTSYRMVGSTRSCIPCPGYACLHYAEPRCIRDVSVARVLEAIEEVS